MWLFESGGKKIAEMLIVETDGRRVSNHIDIDRFLCRIYQLLTSTKQQEEARKRSLKSEATFNGLVHNHSQVPPTWSAEVCNSGRC